MRHGSGGDGPGGRWARGGAGSPQYFDSGSQWGRRRVQSSCTPTPHGDVTYRSAGLPLHDREVPFGDVSTRARANTPVDDAGDGNVTIAGTIDVSGANGARARRRSAGQPGAGGPGGLDAATARTGWWEHGGDGWALAVAGGPYYQIARSGAAAPISRSAGRAARWRARALYGTRRWSAGRRFGGGGAPAAWQTYGRGAGAGWRAHHRLRHDHRRRRSLEWVDQGTGGHGGQGAIPHAVMCGGGRGARAVRLIAHTWRGAVGGRPRRDPHCSTPRPAGWGGSGSNS